MVPKSRVSKQANNRDVNLVVVESPAKARTISRILGDRFTVKASLGHVRDLPENVLGIDIGKQFTPTYEVPREKRSVIRDLKESGKNANTIFLATDPDREGEAISWHLAKATGWDDKLLRRVVFHEITQRAVEEAFRHPRGIDMQLVDAQQARRVLDRLVGYQISPLLWKKVQRGLSAGRVQSVSLRLVVEREDEITAFVSQEYWRIEARLSKETPETKQFIALLQSQRGHTGRLRVPDEATARKLVTELESASFVVHTVKKREVHQSPAPPFVTSTLQQEASRKLRFSANRTMSLAQQLYEGIPLGSEGSVGLITYMRTDSVHVSSGAVHETREYVKQKYGEEFLPKNVRTFTRKSVGAQEAHEAIRPTAIARTPESVARYLSRDQARLYELIWERMVASQMASAISDATTVDIDAHCHGDGKTFVFRAAGSVLRFHGFRILYLEGKDDTTEDSEESEVVLPPLKEKEQLLCLGLNPEQRFTQPPPRYSEATLIRALEEKGIGRPSTYATIISTLFERGYVVSEQRRLVPTILGKSVCNLLKDRFPSVMDIEFTARMEQDLDRIAQGETKWVPVIAEFYTPFQKALVAAENIPPVRIPKPPPKPTNELCPQCGKPLVIRNGRFGEFIACSGFPSCRFTKPLVKDTGIKCPKCGEGVVVERRSSKKGRVFYGCSKYPNCDFVTNRKPLPQKCPECGGMLVSQGRNSAQCTKCAYRGPAPEEDSQLAEVSETQ